MQPAQTGNFIKMSKGNNKIILLFISICFLFFISIPLVYAADQTAMQKAKEGLDNTAKAGYGVSDAKYIPIQSVPTAIGKIIGSGLAFIGLIFFILMIYGGFIWMLARGNEQEVTKAKNLIMSAIIGLIIVLGAYAITYYIGDVLTNESK